MLRFKICLSVLLVFSFLLTACSQNILSDTDTDYSDSYYLYDEVNEITIAQADNYVFLEAAKLDSAQYTLPQNFKGEITITYLGDHLFSRNETVVDLIVPDGYEEIGHFAFYECPNLESLTLGKDVKKIGDLAFSCCPKLSKFSVSDENPHLYEKDGCIIERETETLVLSNGNIPQGVKIIGFCVFVENKKLDNVTIPEGVEAIMGTAFDFSSVASVLLPDSLKKIDTAAFSRCSELKEIYIPASVVTVGAHVFYANDGITINCESESKPDGWDEEWLDGCTNYTINWGVTREG